jgi:hypothetical protein
MTADAASSGGAPELAEHLIEMDASWALWRWAGVRGAGFPAQQALALEDAECARAADDLLDAEQRARQCRLDAHEALTAHMREVDAERRALLRKGIRGLRKGRRLPEVDSVAPAPVAAALDAFEAAEQRLEATREEFCRAVEAAQLRTSRALRQAAADERFREALLWQNHAALKSVVDAFGRRKAGSRRARARHTERLVTRYLQRYALKNETIGFFGPLAWARLAREGEAITSEPGPELLATRTTYFEGWSIDALAEALGRDEAMRPWLRPRRFPFLVVDGSTVHRGEGDPVRLSEAARTLLGLADGHRTAAELAAELVARSDLEPREAAEVYAMLDGLREKGLLAWRLEVPLSVHPERELRRELERIGEAAVRERALRKLDELEEAREGVARAAGDPEALELALETLEAAFRRLTGKGPVRVHGKSHVVGWGRTLVYEDCRRDLDVVLGPELLRALAPPLSILLRSARWLSQEMASKYRPLFREIFTELCAQSGSPAVPLPLFLKHALLRISAPGREIAADFQERWQRLLPVEDAQRAVSFRCEDLLRQAEELFASEAPGWRNARYHCPDVLIAAASVEDIREGRFHFVLGEIHPTLNTLGMELFLAQHPDPDQLRQAVAKDLSTPGVFAVVPKAWTAGARESPGIPLVRTSSRTKVGLISPADDYLELAADPTGAPPGKALPVGSARVVDRQGILGVPSLTGDRFFDLLDVFHLPLTHLASGIFKLSPPQPHTPRVSLDRLVLWRESWRCQAGEMSFLDHPDEKERYLGARRWAREKSMPRRLFFKTPLEAKPISLSLDSPPSVEVFVKMARKVARGPSPSQTINLSEMLPGPDQLWLTDAEGRRYTSELRFVAVDRAALE